MLKKKSTQAGRKKEGKEDWDWEGKGKGREVSGMKRERKKELKREKSGACNRPKVILKWLLLGVGPL